MPNDLVLVRHGQSEGNVATKASEEGDNSWYTDAFTTTPGHQWRLTDLGRAQAEASGEWLLAEFSGGRFDRYSVSPYVRARETAGHLHLPDASWQLNRALRERDWGDIGTLPKDEFESRPEYQLNAHLKKMDPLYWVAPGGESIAHVAEDRVRNVLSTLHRECTGQRVILVTHGEVIASFRLVLERMDDAKFKEVDEDEAEKVHNCEILHYTRLNPLNGTQAKRLSWLRRAYPEGKDPSSLKMVFSPWQEVESKTYSNDELLEDVGRVPQLFSNLPD
jgi:broad specificity phosphatase PhoE